MHYTRWKRHGDPLMVERSGPKRKHGPFCAVEGCLKPNRNGRPYCDAHHDRFVRHGDPLGSAPPRVLDPNPSYKAMHFRLIKARGKASDYACVDCANPARDWSFDYTGESLSAPHGPYGTDIWAYSPRCRSCHKTFDNAHQ